MTPSVSFTASGLRYLSGNLTNPTKDDAVFAVNFAADVVIRLERLGLAPFLRTGEWFPPDEEAYLKSLVPDWDDSTFRIAKLADQ
jgi:hypothetical protein